MANDGSVIIEIDGDSSKFERALKGLNNVTSGVIKGISVAVSAAGTALVGLSTGIVSVGMEYESQMSRVQALLGDVTADQMEQLDALAKKLGGDTVFSAKDAAAGMEELASAGFGVSEVMSAMPGLLDLAAISGGNVAEATEVCATTLNAFQLEADRATHVADVFATVAANTNVEVTDMGYAMKYVATVANAAGLSLEETSAAIGILADAGIKGSQAGTSLRTAITRIAKPTKQMQDTMDALNISFYDGEGNMLSLTDQVAQLQNAFTGLTQEEKQNALVTLYGQESLTSMLALIDAGPEKLAEMTAELEACDGAAKDMAETMLDNLAGSVENLKGSLETLGLDIYEEITDPLKEIVNEADACVAQLQEAFTEGGIDGLVSELGTVLAQAATYVADFAPEFVDAGVSVIQSLVDGISENAGQLATCGLELAASLLSGIGEITVSMTEAGLRLIISLLEGIQQGGTDGIVSTAAGFVMRLATAFGEALPQIASIGSDILLQLISSISAQLPTLAASGVEIIGKLAEGLATGVPAFIAQALPIILEFTSNLRSSAGQLIEAGLSLIVSLAEGLIAALPELIAYVPEIVTNIAEIINENAPKLLVCALNLILQLITGIIDSIPVLIENAGKIVEAIWSVITATNWLSLGSSIMTALKDGIAKIGPTILQTGKDLAKSLFDLIKNTNWLSLGQNIIQFLTSGLSSMGSMLLSAAQNVARMAFDAMKNIDWWALGKDIVSGIANGVSGAIGLLADAAWNLAQNALSALKSAFEIGSPSKLAKREIGRWIPPGIGEGFEDAMPELDADMRKSLLHTIDDASAAVASEVGNVSHKLSGTGGHGGSGGDSGSIITNENGMTVIVYYTGSGEPEDIEKIGREIGTAATRELRRKGLPTV